jgi:hypothetical protein
MFQINKLAKLPPKREKVETIEILRQLSKSTNSLCELKEIAKTIPNQEMLINAVAFQEAKDSSEIENIITTQDQLYKALATNSKQPTQVKEVINYRSAIFYGFQLIKEQGFLKLKDIETIQKTIIENNAGIRSMANFLQLQNDFTEELKIMYMLSRKKIITIVVLGLILIQNQGIAQTDVKNQLDYNLSYEIVYKGWEFVVEGSITYLIADSKGTIYCNRRIGKDDERISKLIDGKNWIDITNDNDKLRIFLTKTDELGYQTRRMFRILVGNEWESKFYNDFEEHKGIENLNLENYTPLPEKLINVESIPYQIGQTSIIGTRPQSETCVVYKLAGNNWKKLGEFKYAYSKYFGYRPLNLIVVNDKLYRTDYAHNTDGKYVNCLVKFNDSVTNTMSKKVYKIKAFPIIKLDSSVLRKPLFQQIGIFEVNGKKGIRHINGDTIVYPIFDFITLEPGYSALPDKYFPESFHLVGTSMNFYVEANYYQSPMILKGFIDTVGSCSKCKGIGKVGQIIEKRKELVEIKEWVPEKKETIITNSSDRYNQTTKRWETTKNITEKITPGYYKIIGSEYKDKIIIINPGIACVTCESGKIKHFITRKNLYFDKTINRYSSKIVNESFEK